MHSAQSSAPDRIRRMFSALAPRYDRFNRWSSLGMDRAWRRRAAGCVRPGDRVLDLGAGTGDMSALALAAGAASVVGMDFSLEMLRCAQGRVPGPGWVQGGAERLPFPSESFDAVLSAYVMRNLQRGGVLDRSLAEARRVLKPGGRLVFLDLTRPRSPLVRWGHRIYMVTFVAAVGRVLFGAQWPGGYLKSSIEELLPESALKRAFEAAGFRNFRVQPVMGGLVSLFLGER